ncbi:TadE/TadG family type IV pilus assembly protein [uncultured Caulobacter sp.]|uniref:TadE/TadG family type IV pilus assembly protein n=1 Tax=uncultured Caulobacter sp. TaxID=158749 RepID=UPI00260BCAE9|nr:TadE/TadG family type IV pilus assembly protein [uncultured Caulobacter sp.]
MPTQSRFLRRLSEGVAAFAARLGRDQRGAIAVQFAFLALPLSVLVFGLVDVSRVSLQRRQMQDALDAATLMAARSSAVTDADLDTVGDAAFLTEITGMNLGLTATSSTFATGAGNKVIGTATGTIKPIIANLWTGANITVTARSEVVRSVNKLEVALVLDNTGSMASKLGSTNTKKIDALKSAAKSLVNTLAAAAGRASDTDAVKISVVPFSMTVNVGSIYQTASWMSGTQPSAYGSDVFASSQNRFTLLSNLGLTWAGCVESRPDPYDIQDTAPSSGTPATLFVPFFAPDEPDDNTVYYDSWNRWRDARTVWGGDIQNNWITNDKNSSTDWFTRQAEPNKYAASNKAAVISDAKTGTNYGPNAGCGLTNLLRLTNVRTAAGAQTVNDKLDQMIANGNTNIAMGAMWGWHTLSPNAPFADGAAYGTPKTQKIMVLLTDGDNTNDDYYVPNGSIYTGYGYMWQKRLKNSSNVALDENSSETDRRDAIDSRQAQVCANAKAAGVLIYSIGVGVSSHSKGNLQACASRSDMYYDVTDATQLSAVFNSIAGAIQNLRISK